jgi:hypothetical protein
MLVVDLEGLAGTGMRFTDSTTHRAPATRRAHVGIRSSRLGTETSIIT